MPPSLPRRLARFTLAVCAFVAVALALPAGSASAHNSLVSSDPADGAVLESAPTQITWDFENPVPLDTLTVTLVDAAGVRTTVDGSTHGAAGDTQVVTPLPALDPGDVSLRWRLVGADGHPVTGRVGVTIGPATVATQPEAAPAPAGTAVTPDANPIDASPDDANPEGASVAAGDGSFSTPSLLRWLLRYGSYLAIMAVVGILLTSAWVWPSAGTHRVLRRILSRSLITVTVLGLAQLLVVASDVTGKAPWSSLGSIDAATTTDAGLALLVRIVVAPAMWLVIFRSRPTHPDVYWTAVSLPGLVLLATWAFAGHSASMRWPEIGVATDVAHFAAAAVWIAGLAIVGWIVIPRTEAAVMVPAVRNFSRVAATSVVVLVVTGLIQSWRLVGNPADLIDGDHGRYLAVKVVALAGMLLLAFANRRRVAGQLDDASALAQRIGPLRRAIVAEFAIGLIIIAVTAALVVADPATRETDADAPDLRSSRIYYTV